MKYSWRAYYAPFTVLRYIWNLYWFTWCSVTEHGSLFLPKCSSMRTKITIMDLLACINVTRDTFHIVSVLVRCSVCILYSNKTRTLFFQKKLHVRCVAAGATNQEKLTPPGHLVYPLVSRDQWMSTVVLYYLRQSDGASVLLFFIILQL